MAFHIEVIFIGYIASDPIVGIDNPRTPVKCYSLATVEQPGPPGCKAQIAPRTEPGHEGCYQQCIWLFLGFLFSTNLLPFAAQKGSMITPLNTAIESMITI